MKILIVDDEEDIAGLIQFHLEEEGFQTEVCHNGMEVLPRLEKNLPDGIILDLMLPGIGGYGPLQTHQRKIPTNSNPHGHRQNR